MTENKKVVLTFIFFSILVLSSAFHHEAHADSLRALGKPILVNKNIEGIQSNPVSTYNNKTKEFLVAYQDDSSGNMDIYVAAISEKGKRKKVFRINEKTAGDQEVPFIAVLKNGYIAVSYFDDYEVKLRIFNKKGSPIGNSIYVGTSDYCLKYSCGDGEIEAKAAITGLDPNGILVTWYIDDYPGKGLFGKIFDNKGRLKRDKFEIPGVDRISGGETTVGTPRFLPFRNRVAMTWVQNDASDRPTVMYQVLNNSGKKIGKSRTVSKYKSGERRYPSIAMLSNGNFVIAWEDTSGALPDTNDGIHAQIVKKSGKKVGKEIIVTRRSYDNEKRASVAALSKARFTVAWHEGRFSFGLHAQLFSKKGKKLGDEAYQEITWAYENARTAMASNGKDKVLLGSSVATPFKKDFSGVAVEGILYRLSKK